MAKHMQKGVSIKGESLFLTSIFGFCGLSGEGRWTVDRRCLEKR